MPRTFLLTGFRVGLQAAFFVLLPTWAGTEVAGATYLSIAVAAFVNPVAALGSQFKAIRSAARVGTISNSIASALLGFVVTVCVSVLLGYLYGPRLTALIPALLPVYIAANYIRLYVDAIGKGYGRYNVVQLAYGAFWLTKIVAAASIAQWFELGYFQIVALELVASSPWVLVCGALVARSFRGATWSLSWKDDLTVACATLARMAWMEADKLLLPIILNASSYVSYSLAIRPSTAGISLVAASLGVATPRIVREGPGIIRTLLREGRVPVLVATMITGVGTAVVLWLYPEQRGDMVPISVIALTAVGGYYISHVYADYLFYHVGPWPRFVANLVGALIVVLGCAAVHLGAPLPTVVVAIALSYLVVIRYARSCIVGL